MEEEQTEKFPIKCCGCGEFFVAWNQVYRFSEKYSKYKFCKTCIDKLAIMKEKAECNILRGFVKFQPEE